MNKKSLTGVVFVLASFASQAQTGLGFCQGNSGDAIFEEDFGQGTQNGPALPPGTTTYDFVNGNDPNDGEYTITNSTSAYGWNLPQDHTLNDENGKAFIVNASNDSTSESGLFYQIPINGLCINNSYEFSAWLINILPASGCEGNGIPVNVRFQIWDETNTIILAEGDTGNINGTSSPVWEQFALTFTTQPGQNSVILKMLNNGIGGCGNDLAIDDIVFKSCGDFTEIISENSETNIQLCEGESLTNLTLEASPGFSVYKSPNYQWQNSQDGDNWTNIPGETNNLLIVPQINSDQFYRVLVAEDFANVNSTACNSISSVFEVNLIEFIDPVSLGDVFICEGDSQSMAVETDSTFRVNWYDSENAGNLLAENTFEFKPENNGTYYAEATTLEGNCTNPERVAIQYTVYETPELEDETLEICEGERITLSETIENVDYVWSTGETGSSIEVDTAGIYRLELITADNCVVSKAFVIESIFAPQISAISKVDNSLVIETVSEGDFSYSINGFSYQSQPVFDNIEGGLYTVYVRENSGCGIATEEFIFLEIPAFFTPNADQINDTFKIEGDLYFDVFEIIIFDRFGKILVRADEAPFEWDGTYNGNNMPADDYWYRILIDNQTYSGNITLTR
ncbi:T9SS type B sorting domain-containing protein [Psychroflexus sediminis]|uniref:Gliding motility-associated C-terminal domain-containing protein n=1 Tax=Psychroflexus sediminis TaxID=470826 RepID=A0A1G7XU08_9FLAO|nr:T9SS type B sorting domain-containing protein [Psychroflexus sediminis]SDG87659.1 gliding motility-associated C-terminal domain-containing protein [Psychroflexus sediminis]